MTAADKLTGAKADIVISNSKGRNSDETIARMMAEADAFREEDASFRRCGRLGVWVFRFLGFRVWGLGCCGSDERPSPA